MKEITILIPTYERTDALLATLTSLSNQTYRNFDIVISDQSDSDEIQQNKTLQTIIRLLGNHGNRVTLLKNLPRHGLAQQRHFLLSKSETPFSLFLDDDLLLEPYVFQNMITVMNKEQCGFVGCAPIGLSFLNDFRQEEEYIEFWDEQVKPEKVVVNGEKWDRFHLHNAANILHVAQKRNLDPANPLSYKIAWVGGCVLYDTKKLRDCGEFSFWNYLPNEHAGEDVLVQLRMMDRFGGCGIIPSGVYHQELPTTIINRSVNAPEYIGE